MSKYANSLFSYSVHSTVNLPAWRRKDTNVISMSFLGLFTRRLSKFSQKLLPKEKSLFKITWQMLSKLRKSVRNCQHPISRRSHQN